MISFLDGPAHGESLNLRRAPVMLRVVHGHGWDALDMPDDEPRSNESVWVYVQVGTPMVGHIRASRKELRGAFASATYRLLPVQPSPFYLSNEQWGLWCEVNESNLLAVRAGLEKVK